MILKHLTTIVVILCLFNNSCKTETASNQNTSNPKDVLEVVSVEPTNPAVLELGKKFNIMVFYELNSSQRATIWARPYVNDRLARGYNAHHLISVEKEDKNSGFVACWFYFNQPTQIDEVRVFMKDSVTGKTVKTISHKINAKWTGQQSQ